MVDDPPPKLGPDELPTPEEIRRLACKLLHEQAEYDPELARLLEAQRIPKP